MKCENLGGNTPKFFYFSKVFFFTLFEREFNVDFKFENYKQEYFVNLKIFKEMWRLVVLIFIFL